MEILADQAERAEPVRLVVPAAPDQQEEMPALVAMVVQAQAEARAGTAPMAGQAVQDN